ncbi:MAG: hypothetical protein AAF074_09365 [Pseudomonadota bacterium]
MEGALACALRRWSPEIGDPSAMGWATVAGYFAAAMLALAVAARPGRFPAESRRREALFWAGMVLVLLALGINKQLDLQSFATAIGRCVAQAGGWYEARRPVQLAAVLALAGAVCLGGLGLALLLRGTLARNGLALAGLVALGGFVLVRAVGFTHVDRLINLDLAGLRVNWVLELGAIALAAAGARRALARAPAAPC